jgi:acyl transferase domain-containing protein
MSGQIKANKTYAVFPGLDALWQEARTRKWLETSNVREFLDHASNYAFKITGQEYRIENFLREHSPRQVANLDHLFLAHASLQFAIYKHVRHLHRIDGLVDCSAGYLARLAASESLGYEEAIALTWLQAKSRHLAPKGILANVRPAQGEFTIDQIEWLKSKFESVSIWSNRHAAVPGTSDKIAESVAEATAQNLKIRKMYPYPFHSKAMIPAAEFMRAETANWELKQPTLPVYSSVWLRHISDPEDIREESLAIAYSPVLWLDSLNDLATNYGVTHLLNIGPSNTLTGWINESVLSSQLKVIDTLDL